MAAGKPYIAPNPPTHAYWLVFDLDHPNSFIWEDAHLPPPNIIVQNPSNHKSHLYYAITPVCVTDKARPRPIAYMEAIQRAMALELRADEAYTGRIAKNPLCSSWKVTELHGDEYSLGELADYLELQPKPFKRVAANDGGRNTTLFNHLRHWAYSEVDTYRNTSTEPRWHDAVLSKALSLATIEPDFSYNEIKNTAKSVAKWVWRFYSADYKNRGAMNLTAIDIPLQAKQRLAARRTHELRRNATEKRISDALDVLLAQGRKPTKTAVAAIVGLSRQQISRRYSHLFEPSSTPAPEAVGGKVVAVTFGVHQISAGLQGDSPLPDYPVERIECLDGGD